MEIFRQPSAKFVAIHSLVMTSTQAAPSLRLDLPLVALLRQSEGEDSKPTVSSALERKRELRGKNHVGVRTDNVGANYPVVCDGLVGDAEVVRRPFLCVGEPTALSIWTCPAIRSHTINDDNIGAESAVVDRRVFAVEAA